MGWEPQQVGPNPFFVGKHCELLCWLQRSWFFWTFSKRDFTYKHGHAIHRQYYAVYFLKLSNSF